MAPLASHPAHLHTLPERYIFLYKHFHLYPGIFFTMQILLCSVVMLLPTTLMGATFPFDNERCWLILMSILLT